MSINFSEDERRLEEQIKRQKMAYLISKMRTDIVDKQTSVMETQRARIASVRREAELKEQIIEIENKIAEAELTLETMHGQ